MTEPSIDVLAELRRLRDEQDRLRRGRIGGVACLAIVLCLLTAGARPDDAPKTIEAAKLVLKSPDGKVRASLEYSERLGGARLNFFAPNGDTRIAIASLENGNDSLIFYDPEQKSGLRAQLGAFKGHGLLRFLARDLDGSVRSTVLGNIAPGAEGLAIGSQTKPRIVLGQDEAGRTALTFSRQGRPGEGEIHLGQNPDGEDYLTFLEVPQHPRMGISRRDGTSSLTMLDGAGKPRLNMQSGPDGKSLLRLLDKDGKPTTILREDSVQLPVPLREAAPPAEPGGVPK